MFRRCRAAKPDVDDEDLEPWEGSRSRPFDIEDALVSADLRTCARRADGSPLPARPRGADELAAALADADRRHRPRDRGVRRGLDRRPRLRRVVLAAAGSPGCSSRRSTTCLPGCRRLATFGAPQGALRGLHARGLLRRRCAGRLRRLRAAPHDIGAAQLARVDLRGSSSTRARRRRASSTVQLTDLAPLLAGAAGSSSGLRPGDASRRCGHRSGDTRSTASST